jgi:glycosyltransferase involved in cell wall biosynthesis
MKILVVHNYYQQPGGERVAVREQTALLKKYGNHVISYTKDNLDINQFCLIDKLISLPNTIFSSSVYREVGALLRKERPDVAHVHNVFPLISPAVYQACKDNHVPIVQTIHNFRFLCPNSLFYTQGKICERCKFGNTLSAIRYRCHRDSYISSTLYALALTLHRFRGTFQHIDRFIALTSFAAQKLVESSFTTPDKIVVLGNFLSEPFPVVGSQIPDDEPYIVFLGRLSSEKGVHVLIDAMASVKTLKLKIMGDGSQMQALQQQTKALGLEQKVEFLGRTMGEKKWPILRGAQASVIPSVWYENLPFVLLESMAVGLPVIASSLGGLPSLIEHGKTGLLFAAGKPDALAEQLNYLMRSPQHQQEMALCARTKIESEYTPAVHYEKLMSIYGEVVT